MIHDWYRDPVDVRLVLAKGCSKTTAANPGNLVEQLLHVNDRVGCVGGETYPRQTDHFALRSVREQHLARRRGVQRQVPAGSAPASSGGIRPGDRDNAVIFKGTEHRRISDRARQPLHVRQRDRLKVDHLLGSAAEPDQRHAEAVPARVSVLFHEAALLERGEQARGRRLVNSETTGQFCHAHLAVPVPQGQQKRRRAVDRPHRVPIQNLVHGDDRCRAGERLRCQRPVHRAVTSQLRRRA